MDDRTAIRRRVADLLVGMDHTDDFIFGNYATLDDLDSFARAAALDAADQIIDVVLTNEDPAEKEQ